MEKGGKSQQACRVSEYRIMRGSQKEPRMSIPKQVLAQAAEADARLQGMRDAAETPPPEPTPEPAPTPPPAPPEKDWKAEYEKAQQRWMAADGMLKKAGQDIRERDAKITQLTAELAQAKAAPPAPAKPLPELLNNNPDLVEAVEHLAEQRVAPLRKELDETRAERDRRREAEALEAKKAEFLSVLDDLVPDWREIDSSPEFAAYGVEIDHTGQQRQAVYMDALHRYDGTTMARFFRRFIEQRPAPVAPPQTPSPPVVPPVAGRSQDLPAAPQGRVWTKREIDEFYSDAAKGVLARRGWSQQRIDETEREIMAAWVEGRVRP